MEVVDDEWMSTGQERSSVVVVLWWVATLVTPPRMRRQVLDPIQSKPRCLFDFVSSFTSSCGRSSSSAFCLCLCLNLLSELQAVLEHAVLVVVV